MIWLLTQGHGAGERSHAAPCWHPHPFALSCLPLCCPAPSSLGSSKDTDGGLPATISHTPSCTPLHPTGQTQVFPLLHKPDAHVNLYILHQPAEEAACVIPACLVSIKAVSWHPVQVADQAVMHLFSVLIQAACLCIMLKQNHDCRLHFL